MNQNDAKIIMAWISKNLVDCEDPYLHGKALQGDLKGKWRQRKKGSPNSRMVRRVTSISSVTLDLSETMCSRSE